MTDQASDGMTGAGETQSGGTPSNRVHPKLLEILVCPLTKTNLIYDEAAQELISRAAGLAYPIRDGIPIMLADEARQLSEDELDRRS